MISVELVCLCKRGSRVVGWWRCDYRAGCDSMWCGGLSVVFFQAEDGIRDLVRSRGLGDVYKRQLLFEACLLFPEGLVVIEDYILELLPY